MGALSFTTVKGLKPKRNNFNKSHGVSFPGKMGLLMPVLTDFLMPGSYARLSDSLHSRMMALVSPIMDTTNTFVHYWNVPIRLIDDKFKKFIGNEIDPQDYNPVYYTPKGFVIGLDNVERYLELGDSSTNYGDSSSSLLPQYNDLYYAIGGDWNNLNSLVLDEFHFNSSLLEMLGYVGTPEFWETSNEVINLYEFKAYILLLKHWYTNENITIHFPTYVAARGDNYTGEDDHMWSVIDDFMTLEGNQSEVFAAFYFDMVCNFGLKAHFNHAWSKDYFTSALPNTQYGDAVSLPVSGRGLIPEGSSMEVKVDSISPSGMVGAAEFDVDNSGNTKLGTDGVNIDGLNLRTTEIQEVKMENAFINIIELRIAETFQLFKERIMRAGRRYREYLKMFFNVISSDATLQDPQWLGGGRVALNVSDIPQMSATNGVTPQGNLAGKASQFGQNFAGFRFYTEEWCILIGVAYMQPDARYVGGIERNKMKTNDIYDWFNPTFEHIGEQPIYMAELYAGGGVTPGEVFGYQRRYAEYTFKNDRMCGAFKNNLSHWTAGLRIFDSKPALNQQFIYVQPSTFDRIFAVADTDNDGNILFWWYHNYVVKQPQSKYGTPGLYV